jgi:hypothetical protein
MLLLKLSIYFERISFFFFACLGTLEGLKYIYHKFWARVWLIVENIGPWTLPPLDGFLFC